jgi:hypothetical protein
MRSFFREQIEVILKQGELAYALAHMIIDNDPQLFIKVMLNLEFDFDVVYNATLVDQHIERLKRLRR